MGKFIYGNDNDNNNHESYKSHDDKESPEIKKADLSSLIYKKILAQSSEDNESVRLAFKTYNSSFEPSRLKDLERSVVQGSREVTKELRKYRRIQSVIEAFDRNLNIIETEIAAEISICLFKSATEETGDFLCGIDSFVEAISDYWDYSNGEVWINRNRIVKGLVKYMYNKIVENAIPKREGEKEEEKEEEKTTPRKRITYGDLSLENESGIVEKIKEPIVEEPKDEPIVIKAAEGEEWPYGEEAEQKRAKEEAIAKKKTKIKEIKGVSEKTEDKKSEDEQANDELFGDEEWPFNNEEDKKEEGVTQ